MTPQEFEDLVARLEETARRNPRSYRLRVLLLATAGYCYVGGILLVAGVLTVASALSLPYLKAAAVKLTILFGAFFYLVGRAMWVRLDAPRGRRVTRQEAPALFKLLDGVQRPLATVRFDEVLITDDFNAAVVQVPRLGMLGWHRNYLLIGLPLMKALTPAQLGAVLAHELGHLAGGHGRLSNWLYRLRMGWSRLADTLEERAEGTAFIFRPFYRRFVPYFNAYSFPLARSNEFEADRASAKLTSPAVAAEALTGVNVIASFLEARFWPELHRRAEDTPNPAFAPYTQMGPAIAQDIDPEAVRQWLDAALSERTSTHDTHPALADRLAALGEVPRLALPAAGQSSDRLLGSALAPITAEFDRRWQQSIQPAWERRHQEVQQGRAALADLDGRLARGATLSLDEQVERAQLTEAFGAGEDEALALLRALQPAAQDHPGACYALGLRLLKRDDEAGLALIERAMTLDADAILPGAELLRDFHARHGRDALARQWHQRLVERAQWLNEVRVERSELRAGDKLAPHGLDRAVCERLREQLSPVPGLKRVYLVRKLTRRLPEQPLIVIGFTCTPWWRLFSVKRAESVQQAMLQALSLPVDAIVLNLEGANSRWLWKFRFKRNARLI